MLGDTTAHYVRCIKPNMQQKPSIVDPDMVLAQLRYAGMLETIRIRKCGYPVRYPHADFVKRFAITVEGVPRQADARAKAKYILDKLAMPEGTWQLGLTKARICVFACVREDDKANGHSFLRFVSLRR